MCLWRSGWLPLEPKHLESVTSIATSSDHGDESLVLSGSHQIKSWTINLSDGSEPSAIGSLNRKVHEECSSSTISALKTLRGCSGELAMVSGNTCVLRFCTSNVIEFFFRLGDVSFYGFHSKKHGKVMSIDPILARLERKQVVDVVQVPHLRNFIFFVADKDVYNSSTT